MIKPKFVHLHVRSDYSMVDGLSKVNELIDTSKFLKMPILAITDFSNLFGSIKFYDYAYKKGIKPIIGADLVIKDDILINGLSPFTCLVMNKQGYNNLIVLISKSYKNKYKNLIPVIQRDWLIKYNAGLIILSGGCNGDIGQCLLHNKKNEIQWYLSFYKKYFPDRFYLELIRTHRPHEELYIHLALKLSLQQELPVVASNDIRFIKKEDFQTHEIRVAIHDGIVLNKTIQNHKYSVQQFFKSEEEMCALFSDIPEALINSVEISYRCNLMIDVNKHFLPKFPTDSLSDKDFLILNAKNGLEERLKFLFPYEKDREIKRKQYDIRLKYELNIINQMELPSYFLIVMEFIQWAKKNDIPVGPGRGSGASSLVAYALRITELDPLKFNLLFERFLNPERISMPDLDIDFCMERRDLVIDHVFKMYGENRVSQIITFGTMTAKAVVRDVGRVLGLPYVFVNRIAKLIPSTPGVTLEQMCSIESQFKLFYNNDKDVRVLIDTAKKLEGIIKNVSKHAGGVVIAPTKITDFCPLYYDNACSFPMTQFDKDDIERIGLIKFDFLGLRTLTIIDRTLKMINTQCLQSNLNIVNINLISLYDKASFAMLQSAKTTAVFQLESRGIKSLITRLKPDRFEDLIALIALFRPGPLQSGMVDNFINRKHGREIISYPDIKWQHHSLRSVLESTYGIILYQEQIMQIAQVFSGYTLGKADILRHAIGKKKSKDMANQRDVFVSGAISKGINNELSIKIFNLVEKFAGYGFNKSHSVAYSLISYQTLWLKTHYPAEFMAAALSSDMDNTNKIIYLINECKRMKLKIIPPNINVSKFYFYVNENKEIIYGIGAIKGIGKSSIETIINARKENGNFLGLFDFCIRTSNTTKINYRVVEKLIFSGAFDCFKVRRAQMIVSLYDIMKRANQHYDDKCSKQKDMFETYTSINFLYNYNHLTEKWSHRLLLEKEKEALGLYLTDHPIIQYTREIKNYVSNIIEIKDVIKKNSKVISIFGIIVLIRTKLNTQGSHIVICILEDQSGRLEIIISAKLFNKYQYCLKEKNVVFIVGMVNTNLKYNDCKIIAQYVQDINDIRKKYARSLSIILYNEQINDMLLKNIYCLLKKNQSEGKLPIYFYYRKNDIQIKLHCNKIWCITPTDQLLVSLRGVLGDSQVRLELYSNH